MTENFSNEFQTTLNGAIDDDDLTLVVTSATGAPGANFRIRIDDEYMLVTGVSGTTFTVTRGVESSTAVAHSNGADVTHILTAGGLTQALSAVGVRVTHSTVQSITNSGSFVAIEFNSTNFDTTGFHNDVTNNERLTVPAGFAGKYVIGATAGVAANATGGRQLRIRLNGSTYITAISEIPGATTLSYRDSIVTIYDLAVTNYVELMIAHTGSAALNTVNADGLPQFWMYRIG